MAISRIESNSIAPSQTLTTPIIATTMGVGGATPAGSGSGITFPAAQSASSDANTLDDYEEGLWTPTIGGTGADPTGVNYNGNQYGRYTKIGNTVSLFVYVAFNTYTGGSGNIIIRGLPFAAVGTVAGGYCPGATQITAITLSAGNTWASIRTTPSSTYLDLQQQGSGTSWSATGFGAITSNATYKEMLASITYFTA